MTQSRVRFAILGFGHHAVRRLLPAFSKCKVATLNGMWRRDQTAAHVTDGKLRMPVWMLAVLLAVATLAAYYPATRNRFVDFDDPLYVTQNQHVQAGLSWRNVAWAFRSIDAANWHPLTWISHMADCQFFGLNPTGHHAVSVLLHAINAVLLFLLLNKATGFRWRSLCVAGLFALHPLNVETVAWISERKSLLSMLFSLIAVACYGWYVRTPEPARAQKCRRYLAVAFFFALALLSKPMAVTLPLVLLIVDYWPFERLPVPCSTNDLRLVWNRLGKLLVEKIPLFAMSIASSWITVVAQHRGQAMTSNAVLTLKERVGNAMVSYAKYIGKMFWPNGLSYYYPHPGSRLTLWAILAATALLLTITATVWRYRERRHLVFGWKFFVVTLLPVIGIVQVGLQAMADRYGAERLDEHFADTSDTLCYATNENQDATYALIERGADLAIVVGGYNSSNTSHIVALCQVAMATYFIRNADEIISPSRIRHFLLATREMTTTDGWLPQKRPLEIALTCGASCPDAIVDGVLSRILSFFEDTRPFEDVLQPYGVETPA